MFACYCTYSLSQNHLINLRSSLQHQESQNDSAPAVVASPDLKTRCVNADPDVPKCEVMVYLQLHPRDVLTVL